MARREGYIEAKGPAKGLIRWYKPGSTDGKRVRRAKVVKGGKRQAEAALRSVLKSKDDRTYVDPSRTTLDAYLDKWLESMKGSVTARTRTLYSELLKRHVRPELGGYPLQQLETVECQLAIDAMRELSAETVRKTHRVLSQALRQAVEWRMLVRNPASGVKLPKKRSVQVKSALTGDQARALLKAAEGSRWAPLWAFLLATGCRPQEALGLRWSDVDLEAKTVQLGAQVVTSDGHGKVELASEAKTEGALRTVPLPAPTIAVLRDHLKRQREEVLKAGPLWVRELGLVFPNEAGRPMDLHNLAARTFKPLAKAIGVPQATTYWLRHTVATQLLAGGENPKVVAERLGHTSTAMVLDVYGHVLEGMQASATATLSALLYGE